MADKDDGPPPTPDWIVTFTDLMSLLLTFFILLLTFSTPRVEKLFELRGSLRGSFGVFGPERDDRDTDVWSRPMLLGREMKNPFAPAMPPRHLEPAEREPNVEILVRKDALNGDPKIEWDKISGGFRLRLGQALRFAAGSVDLTSTSFARLDRIVEELKDHPYQIIVEAGVGSRDAVTTQSHSMLAERRAIAIAERLQSSMGINPQRIAVAVRGAVEDGAGTVSILIMRSRRWETGHGG